MIQPRIQQSAFLEIEVPVHAVAFTKFTGDLQRQAAINGAYYSAERNGTEHLIPQNTYFAEHIEMGPKQLPSLVAII